MNGIRHSEMDMMNFGCKRVRVLISGKVQGVGFRYWVKGRAMELGLAGWVRNLEDGRVEAVFEGGEKLVKEVIKKIKQGPPLSRVSQVEKIEEGLKNLKDFEIRRD